ncbi:MAG: nucleotidyl transferase AbiEii/AbiGii toxin family protein [Candidatus Micrarchaeia archaeon]|jgi:predicted nucleotidyltransferase component of viral defense system
MELPIEKKLKKQVHLETAILQDIIMEKLVYSLDLVLHGGTSIWRVYKGNRFSEDLDFYMEKWEPDKIKETLKELEIFEMKLKKFKKTKNTVFSVIEKNNVIVKVEASKKHWKFKEMLGEYEKTNGSYLPISTLSAEDLFKEKTKTYLNRRLIRDIYDIYFLFHQCDFKKIEKTGKEFIKNIPFPKDEDVLKSLILTGKVPTFNEIKLKLLNWFK